MLGRFNFAAYWSVFRENPVLTYKISQEEEASGTKSNFMS
jgi:hypothetical protein